jgi:hypothetical protein
MLEFRILKIQKDHARRQYHLSTIICKSSKAKQYFSLTFKAAILMNHWQARRCFALFLASLKRTPALGNHLTSILNSMMNRFIKHALPNDENRNVIVSLTTQMITN